MILAGIDIGTLTCRLLIARAGPGASLAELHADRRILRLGEGVDQRRRLHPVAVQRVIETLCEWRAVLLNYCIDRERAVATSAVRDAVDRKEFLASVKRETGFEVEVISGEEEARLTLLGIRSGLSLGTGAVLGLDIGGGSTEFILDQPGCTPLVHSVDVGVVRLTERLFKHDPPVLEELLAARTLICDQTRAAHARLGDLRQTTFVGTAGTITTLAAMAQELPAYQAARIQGYRLRLEVIKRLEEMLLARRKEERRTLPGLEPGREDIIVAGTVILRTVMETLEIGECLVSDLGLREGLLIDLLQRKAANRL